MNRRHLAIGGTVFFVLFICIGALVSYLSKPSHGEGIRTYSDKVAQEVHGGFKIPTEPIVIPTPVNADPVTTRVPIDEREYVLYEQPNFTGVGKYVKSHAYGKEETISSVMVPVGCNLYVRNDGNDYILPTGDHAHLPTTMRDKPSLVRMTCT